LRALFNAPKVKIHQFRRAWAIPFGGRIDEADVIVL
jgi:hypothetical protein